MDELEYWMKYAADDDDGDDDNVEVINSAWCKNRSGICLSFAIPVSVMSVSELSTFGEEFVKAVKESYRKMLKDFFYAKTDTPVLSSTDSGEMIMIWSFQGGDDDDTRHALRDAGIKEVKYE